jgi:oligoendopeptidase F
MNDEKEQKGSLLPREAIDPRYKWRIEDLYPDDEAWEQDFSLLKELLGEVSGCRGKLAGAPDNVRPCLEMQDRMYEVQERLITYAFRRWDEDTTRALYQEMRSRIQSLSTETSKAASFISPELLSFKDEDLLGLCDREKGLEVYRHKFENLLRFRPHILTSREEDILAMAEDVADGPATIFNFLNNADIRFPWVKDRDGSEIELTKGRFNQFQTSPDREVRKEAFQSFYSVYSEWANTLAATLSASIKKDVFFSRVRGYGATLENTLHRDNIPLEVYDNLLETVNAHLEPLHRYISLKKRVLSLDRVHPYDLFAPLIPEMDFNIPYSEGVQMVIDGLSVLGEDYVARLKQGIESGWIDVYENRGKCSGAYSDAAYGGHPYILMNYNDKLSDVFTLAHELGHAINSFYTFRDQPFVYCHTPIFLAEVASTTNEIILVEHLLAHTDDRDKRLYLLNKYTEQIRGTVYIQALFSEIERRMHEQIEKEGALTATMLNGICKSLYARYFGPDFEMSDLYAVNWARIPHFYEKFYVYKYATGFSAAKSLADSILSHEPGSVARYLDFLGRGSSDYPLALLRQAGVDMSRPGPIVKVAEKFNRILEEMEDLLTES